MLKKTIYILLVVFLGKLLAFVAFSLLEMKFMKIMFRRHLSIEGSLILGSYYTALPQHLFWIFMTVGALFGLWLGFRWWRIVYVEKRHWRMRSKKTGRKAGR